MSSHESASSGRGATRSVDALLVCLDAMVHEHEKLLALTRAQRELIGRGEHHGLSGNVEAQNECVQRIDSLESSRRSSVRRLMPADDARTPASGGARGPRVSAEPTVLDVADTLPGPDAERVRDAARRLREVIVMIQSENAAIRTAAESIARHFQGLTRQVADALSHTGTYVRSGRVGGTPSALAPGLDLTT